MSPDPPHHADVITGLRRLRPHLDRRTWSVLALLTVLTTAAYVVRLSAPSDLEGYGQHRNIGYVMDALARNNWALPHDLDGKITSKPPLHTWLAAGSSWVFDDINRFTLTLPSYLAILGTAWLIFLAGRGAMGFRAACCGAVFFATSPMAIKHVAMVRPDAVFTFTIALAAWLAFRAWRYGRSWTPFWLAVTASILTKGPLGLVLAAGGLLARFSERRTGRRDPGAGGHLVGLACMFGCVGLWAWLAWQARGAAVVEKMVFDELLGHAAGDGRSTVPGTQLGMPLIYLMGRFAPWSLLTAWAVYAVWRHPADDEARRSWERFVACWLVAGLAVFALAAHHRADHLLPLLPAAAMLAGRQIESLTRLWSWPIVRRLAAGAVALLLLSQMIYYHQMPPRRAEVAARTESMRQLALELRERFGEDATLLPVDTPTTLALYLKDYSRKVSMPEAAARLQGGGGHYMLVRDLAGFQNQLDTQYELAEFYNVLHWSSDQLDDLEIYIIGGHN